MILCLDKCYGFNEEPQILPENSQVGTKNKYRIWLTFGSIVLSPFDENAYGP
jgi:hypothetical protein